MTDTNSKPIAPSGPRLLSNGLDSLYINYTMDTLGSQLDFEELAYQKALRLDDRSLEYETLQLGSKAFVLRPYGAHPYKYVLVCENWEVKLAENMQPNMHVCFASKALWLEGLDSLNADIEEWLASLGLRHIRPESISRADWAFDFHLPNADIQAGHFVSRADKDSTWRNNGNVETITFGKGDTVVRIYDKVAEINQQSDKRWFFQIWEMDQDVWRVEVQVRGPRLKLGSIRTIADMQALQADLLREIPGTHATLRTPSKDTNRSRWPLAPLWTVLLRDIEEMPQTGLVAAYDPTSDIEWRLQKTCESLYGYPKRLRALTVMLAKTRSEIDLGEFTELLPDLLYDYYSAADWHQDLERRIKAMELGQ